MRLGNMLGVASVALALSFTFSAQAEYLINDGNGGYYTPHGAVYKADGNGGFISDSGVHIYSDGNGGFYVPGGERIHSDGQGGYIIENGPHIVPCQGDDLFISK